VVGCLRAGHLNVLLSSKGCRRPTVAALDERERGRDGGREREGEFVRRAVTRYDRRRLRRTNNKRLSSAH